MKPLVLIAISTVLFTSSCRKDIDQVDIPLSEPMEQNTIDTSYYCDDNAPIICRWTVDSVKTVEEWMSQSTTNIYYYYPNAEIQLYADSTYTIIYPDSACSGVFSHNSQSIEFDKKNYVIDYYELVGGGFLTQPGQNMSFKEFWSEDDLRKVSMEITYYLTRK